MKITPALQEELANWLDTYWSTYLKGDIETWATFIHDDYRNIGGTKGEIWNSKQEMINYSNSIMDQMPGTADLRNRKVELIPYGEYLMAHEFTDLFVKVEGEWTFYGPFRMSSLLEKTTTGWIALHQHGSYPDMKAMEGKAFSIDVLKAENAKLQAAVKSRTMELEIEAALERVRAEAVGIKKPDDILAICKIMFRELLLLGFPDLRNTLINFWDDERSSLIDYDYSDDTGGNKSILSYSSHPVFEQFQKKIKNSKDAFAELVVTKDQLESWKQRRRDSGEYEDPRLNHISALYYYFYSIGVGAIGISTFSPISEDQLNTLKRFRNVFDFAYRRYADVAHAEAQAREAQIELGLERVRARAMAMQNSDELKELIGTVFTELTRLDLVLTRCVIMIYNAQESSTHWWMANSEDPHNPAGFYIKQHQHPPMVAYFKAWHERKLKYSYALQGKIKQDWDAFLFSETELKNLPGFVIEGMKAPDLVHLNASFNNFGNLTLASLEPLSDEHFDILLRFAKVFDLTYTRFNDLQKAEAQAREAQIIAALEKVRSSSLAMHNSEELGDVVKVVFENLRSLGLKKMDSANINILHKESKEFDLWLAAPGQEYTKNFRLPYLDHPIANDFFETVFKGETLHKRSYAFEVKNAYFRYMFENSDNRNLPEDRKKLILGGPGYAVSAAIAGNSSIFVHNYSGESLSDEDDLIVVRFSKVFDQAYTRFLDLQKAEALAKEAQVEAALERVRSRTMAMQGSENLFDVIREVNEQLLQLGFRFDSADFMTEYSEKGYNIWLASAQETFSTPMYISYSDTKIPGLLKEVMDRGDDFFTFTLNRDEKNRYFEHVFNTPVAKNASEESKQRVFSSEGMAVSCVVVKNIILSIANFACIPYTDSENDIIKRFGFVFEQSYTRFLDLQKAEAQAREAKIEAALERVRSRTIGMQKSKELREVIQIVFDQLRYLDFKIDSAHFNVGSPGTELEFAL